MIFLKIIAEMKNTFDRLITRLHMAKGEVWNLKNWSKENKDGKKNDCRTTTEGIMYVKWNYQ